VPERPKNRETSPAGPSLAEQCMESTPRAGSSQCMSVKTPFFISPAYSVPRITCSRRSSDRSMLVRLPICSVRTLAGNWPAL